MSPWWFLVPAVGLAWVAVVEGLGNVVLALSIVGAGCILGSWLTERLTKR